MTTDAHVLIQRPPPLDDPWRRMLWLLPAAILAWIVLLMVFAGLLEQSAPPPPELKPIEARIVEMPAPVGGLQGGGGASIQAKPQPKPVVKPAPHPRAITPPKTAVTPPPSAEGTLRRKSKEPPAESRPTTGSSSADTSTESPADESSSGSESTTTGGAGPGSDATGARAIYAPAPVIPDDLREDVLQTEAVASFKVSADGNVEVSLTTPTPNPRLNQLLLETLRQWRFFPATRAGVAIDAAFDLRIPITVQ
jgi:protein TonB